MNITYITTVHAFVSPKWFKNRRFCMELIIYVHFFAIYMGKYAKNTEKYKIIQEKYKKIVINSH